MKWQQYHHGFLGRNILAAELKRCGWVMIALLSLCAGCRKWLDKKPANNIAVPTTLPDLQALLDDKPELLEWVTPSMPEASADDYFVLQADYDKEAGTYSRVAPYTWDTNPFTLYNDWKAAYYPVYVANLCLQQIETIKKTNGNAEAWNSVKGSAHFLRAYYFLELAWDYAKAYDPSDAGSNPGIALRTDPDINKKSTRATVQQTYDQVISDAKEAAVYLPDMPAHPIRPSRCAAYGLLARAYLSMRLYDSALLYADRALTIYSQLMDFNGDPDIKDISGMDYPFRKYNKEVVFYTSMNLYSTTQYTGLGKIDTLLYNSYNISDLRKTAFFRPVGLYQEFKGSYTPEYRNLFTGIATDELWLMRAECLARRGNKTGALADLDSLLIKRWKTGSYQPAQAADAKEALRMILAERRKELLMRGLRWMDLKRFNKEDEYRITLIRRINGKTYELPPNDNRYAQPLPQEIIDQTGMTQNPR